MIVYKSLNGLRSPFTDFLWPIPESDKPTKWLEIKESPQLCARGFHGWLDIEQAKRNGESVYEMELDGEIVQDKEKAAGQRARLLRKLWPDPEKWVREINAATTVLEKIKIYHKAEKDLSRTSMTPDLYNPVVPCYHPIDWSCAHPEWHEGLEERVAISREFEEFKSELGFVAWEMRTMIWLLRKGVPLE